MALSVNVMGLFRWLALKQPKLAQMDKLLYKWYRAMHSEQKPVTGPVIIKKAKSCYDAVKTADKCTFCEGWLWEPATEGGTLHFSFAALVRSSNENSHVRTQVIIGAV
jgi:hypothetical protein